MFRYLSPFVALLFLFAAPLLARTAMTDVMRDISQKNWTEAQTKARKISSVAADLVEWQYLRAGGGDFTRALDFVERNPDWPGLKYLRKRAEAHITQAGTDDTILFFMAEPPQTPKGALAHINALAKSGQDGMAEAEAVMTWRSMDMDADDQKQFVTQFADLLKPHHAARLEMLLWAGQTKGDKIDDLLDLLPDDYEKLVRAIDKLDGKLRDPDGRVKAVPEPLREMGVLHFARMQYEVRRGEEPIVMRMILDASVRENGLGRADKWAGQRARLARKKMREGAVQIAYDLAANHGLVEGAQYADMEWLSGYLALRYLGDTDTALVHFQNFRDAVVTPISLGRAGYWVGRAYDAAGNAQAAKAAYAFGADYQTSYYGLLAAEQAGLPFYVGQPVATPETPFYQSNVANSSLFQAANLALEADYPALAERFFVQIAETATAEQVVMMGNWLVEHDHPHIAVMFGKKAARRGWVVPAPYYPSHSLADGELPVPPEMALAIARRESEFDPDAKSHAGARGLMQVMPATAKYVADQIDLPHTTDQLYDWEHNVVIGSAYLEELGHQFSGNVVLVAAGYNAGPHRSEAWMQRFGDPRDGGLPIIDWVEHIPFDETRNYVMRVAESLPIYRAVLGKESLPEPFSAELVGSSVLPLTPKREQPRTNDDRGTQSDVEAN